MNSATFCAIAASNAVRFFEGVVKTFYELHKRTELFEFIKGHAYGEDTGTWLSGSGYLISENRARDFVHDEPDIGFNATDFNVSFIGSQFIGWIIVIRIHKRTDDDSSCLSIVVADTFMDTEVFSVFDRLECMTTVWALEF